MVCLVHPYAHLNWGEAGNAIQVVERFLLTVEVTKKIIHL